MPASFTLTDEFDNLESRPFASGLFADVYKATYKGQPLVAKALKNASVDDFENVHKVSGLSSGQIVESAHAQSQRFAKEVVGWKWFRHENILPFLGVTSNPPLLSMVSTWMENGNITSFIQANPAQNPFNFVGTPCFASDLTDSTHSLWMRQKACNTYTNMILSTVMLKE